MQNRWFEQYNWNSEIESNPRRCRQQDSANRAPCHQGDPRPLFPAIGCLHDFDSDKPRNRPQETHQEIATTK